MLARLLPFVCAVASAPPEVFPPEVVHAREPLGWLELADTARSLDRLEKNRFGSLASLLGSWQTRSGSPQRAPVRQWAEGADAYGWVSFARFFGALARSPEELERVSTLRRLGLDTFAEARWQAWLDSESRLRSQALISLTGERRGLVAALGRAVPMGWPRDVPADAPGFAAASVKPGYLWALAESLAATRWPIELALIKVELLGIENALGKRIARDIFGDAERVWTLYQRPGASVAQDFVLVAPIADASAAAKLADMLIDSLQAAFPELTARRATDKGTRTIILGKGIRSGAPMMALAFSGEQMVAATSEEALRAHLSRRSKRGGSFAFRGDAVAYGVGPGAPALARLVGWAGGDTQEAARAVGPTSWQARFEDSSLSLEALIERP